VSRAVTLLVLLFAACGASCAHPGPLVLAPGVLGSSDIVVANDDLAHHALTNELFHIDSLWIQTQPGSEFYRWLLGESGKPMALVLTSNPGHFGDRRHARILTGTLVHSTGPSEPPIVHVLVLVDPKLGVVSPITLETDDPAVAAKFDEFDNAEVSIVLLGS
jgi:hypothetical protein